MIKKARVYISQIKNVAKFVATLFIGPLAITFLANRAEQFINSVPMLLWQALTTLGLIFLFLLLIIIGYTEALDQTIIRISNKFRKRRFIKPVIYILDGTFGNDRDVPVKPAITNFSVEDWRRLLTQNIPHSIVKVGPWTSKINPSLVQIIVNPFWRSLPRARQLLIRDI